MPERTCHLFSAGCSGDYHPASLVQEVDGLRAEAERQRAQQEEAERRVVERDERIAVLEARADQERRELEVRGMGRRGAMAARML